MFRSGRSRCDRRIRVVAAHSRNAVEDVLYYECRTTRCSIITYKGGHCLFPRTTFVFGKLIKHTTNSAARVRTRYFEWELARGTDNMDAWRDRWVATEREVGDGQTWIVKADTSIVNDRGNMVHFSVWGE